MSSTSTPGRAPGSTIRHLLAHASGLAMHSAKPLARPGARRMYSNYGFTVLAEAVQRESGIEFAGYLTEAVFEPLGMATTRLDGGTAAAGFGATSTVADLALFAGDLLRPQTVSGQMHDEAITVQFPGLDGVLPGYGVQRPNDWGWALRSGMPSRRTGRVRATRREHMAISVRRAGLSGPIRKRTWRWWSSRTVISASGPEGPGRRFRTRFWPSTSNPDCTLAQQWSHKAQ
ncbi:hypothetical protein BZL30_5673 [Mycobacterium kansasii]|uniref:Beta-lactamase-related domain-containing protein n=1 Tax=Mycobacterium kansasii TaxID=1768 RepID=A0A1V3WZ12_MYCKA|nr:hypothetical protein BZL30_5673 [Mycobacterium kansasii]